MTTMQDLINVQTTDATTVANDGTVITADQAKLALDQQTQATDQQTQATDATTLQSALVVTAPLAPLLPTWAASRSWQAPGAVIPVGVPIPDGRDRRDSDPAHNRAGPVAQLVIHCLVVSGHVISLRAPGQRLVRGLFIWRPRDGETDKERERQTDKEGNYGTDCPGDGQGDRPADKQTEKELRRQDCSDAV